MLLSGLKENNRLSVAPVAVDALGVPDPVALLAKATAIAANSFETTLGIGGEIFLNPQNLPHSINDWTMDLWGNNICTKTELLAAAQLILTQQLQNLGGELQFAFGATDTKAAFDLCGKHLHVEVTVNQSLGTRALSTLADFSEKVVALAIAGAIAGGADPDLAKLLDAPGAGAFRLALPDPKLCGEMSQCRESLSHRHS